MGRHGLNCVSGKRQSAGTSDYCNDPTIYLIKENTGRLRSRWQDNIKRDVEEVEWGGMN
jgi:hypothetical protein